MSSGKDNVKMAMLSGMTTLGMSNFVCGPWVRPSSLP